MAVRRVALTVFMIFTLVFLAHTWESQLKLDAMTYAALAKNILSTGDWQTLHYTRDYFPDFYQHPPLAIWLQALIFRSLGISEATARILPALLGLGTVAVVFAWARRLGGAWLALIAPFILLSSGRYVKWATDFYLDGPLAFWLVLSAWLFLKSDDARGGRARWVWAALAGVACSGALLTKGIAGLAAPLMILTYVSLPSLADRRFGRAALTFIAGAVPIVIWLKVFGGAEFVTHYWAESVAYRVGDATVSSRLAPWTLLLRTWWPWLPFFVWGSFRALPAIFNRDIESRWLRMALIGAYAIPVAFTFSGHALDHYLVPFFPFAALVTASVFRHVPESMQSRFHELTRYSVVAIAFILATLPISLHLERRPGVKDFIRNADAACTGAREFTALGNTGMDNAEAHAQLAWLSSREVSFFKSFSEIPDTLKLDRLIITGLDFPTPAGFQVERSDAHSKLKALSPNGPALCH